VCVCVCVCALRDDTASQQERNESNLTTTLVGFVVQNLKWLHVTCGAFKSCSSAPTHRNEEGFIIRCLVGMAFKACSLQQQGNSVTVVLCKFSLCLRHRTLAHLFLTVKIL
jgi:hypothetical protein